MRAMGTPSLDAKPEPTSNIAMFPSTRTRDFARLCDRRGPAFHRYRSVTAQQELCNCILVLCANAPRSAVTSRAAGHVQPYGHMTRWHLVDVEKLCYWRYAIGARRRCLLVHAVERRRGSKRSCFVDSETDIHLPDPLRLPSSDKAREPDDKLDAAQARLAALVAVARYHGVDLDRASFRAPPGEVPSPAALVAWARENGLWAKATRLRWRQLMRMQSDAPLVLLFADGGAGILVSRDADAGIVYLKDPSRPGDEPVAVDELRLANLWHGDVLLVRRERGTSADEEPFSFAWITRLVLQERRSLREITAASISLSVLQILPPFLIMVAIDRVITHQTMSTLGMIALILILATAYETLLGYARREIVEVTSTRIDARLALHVFRRLLALPVDFFERNPTGETTRKICASLQYPRLLYRQARWHISRPVHAGRAAAIPVLDECHARLDGARRLCRRRLGGPGVSSANPSGFCAPDSRLKTKRVRCSSRPSTGCAPSSRSQSKSCATRSGMRASPRQAKRVSMPAASRTSHRPSLPRIEAFINRGVLLVGCYILISSPAGTTGITAGALIAFMLLGGRVASPLIGLAKLMTDIEEVRMSVSQVAEVLNHPTETAAMRTGLRPKFEGAIAFQDLTFHLSWRKDRLPLTASPSRFRRAPCSVSSAAAARESRPSRACFRASIASTAAISRSTGPICARSI